MPKFEPSPARKVVAAVLVAALAIPALGEIALAQEQSAARKFGRGAAGLGLGILEIPGNMCQTGREEGVFAGATLGLGLGLGKFVARELVGAYELLTAPFAVPAGFQPILQPEFPWGYWDQRAGRSYGFTDAYLGEQASEIGALTGAVVTRRGSVLIVAFPKRLRFATDSAELGMDGKARLGELATILNRYPATKIAVRGHADSTGQRAYNLQLSSKRADAVRGYLVGRGVDAARIVSSGRGDADPVAGNDTVAGRERNRRVEIEIRSISENQRNTIVGGTRPG